MSTEEILNISDLVWDYFSKHPYEEISPKDLARVLDSNYNTVNGAINRLHLAKKIIKKKRGIYILSELPRGQTTFENII